MIQLEQLTPSVYYQQSRDFQLLGRLYDVMLNSVKTNSELTASITKAQNTKFLDLLASTLGFKSKHNYNLKQLTAICSILPTIIRNKGSLTAIQLIGDTLLNAEGSTEEFDCDMDGGLLKLYIPGSVTDTTLFRDLLSYVVPAGVTCEVIRIATITKEAQTIVSTSDSAELHTYKDKDTSFIYNGKTENSYAGQFIYTTVVNPSSIISQENTSTESNTQEGE